MPFLQRFQNEVSLNEISLNIITINTGIINPLDFLDPWSNHPWPLWRWIITTANCGIFDYNLSFDHLTRNNISLPPPPRVGTLWSGRFALVPLKSRGLMIPVLMFRDTSFLDTTFSHRYVTTYRHFTPTSVFYPSLTPLYIRCSKVLEF